MKPDARCGPPAMAAEAMLPTAVNAQSGEIIGPNSTDTRILYAPHVMDWRK